MCPYFIFRAIYKPFKGKIRTRTVLLTMLLVITCSLALQMFIIVQYNIKRALMYIKETSVYVDFCHVHNISDKDWLVYNVVASCIGIWAPMLLLIASHIAMFLKLRKEADTRARCTTTDTTQHLKNISKTFLVIVCAFYISVLPNTVLQILIAHYGTRQQVVGEVYINFSNYSILLMNSNSCLNPIIYSKIHVRIIEKIQLVFGQLGTKRWFVNSPNASVKQVNKEIPTMELQQRSNNIIGNNDGGIRNETFDEDM